MFLRLPKEINNSIQKTPENGFPLINVFAFKLKSSLKKCLHKAEKGARRSITSLNSRWIHRKNISAWKDFIGDSLAFFSFLMMQPRDKIQLLYCCVRFGSLTARMKSCGKSVDVTGSRVLVRVHFLKHAGVKWCLNIFQFFLKHCYIFKT